MHTKQELQAAYKKLPPETREVLASEELAAVIETISLSYTLSEQQHKDLAKLILYTVSGLEKQEELAQNIQKTISVDQPTASKIALDIKTKIIQNLDKIHETIERNIEIAEGGGAEDPKNTIPKSKTWSTDHLDKDAAENIRNSVGKQKSVTDLLSEISKG